MVATLVEHLVSAGSFDQAICISKALYEENVALTPTQKESLRQGLEHNDQVYDAFYALNTRSRPFFPGRQVTSPRDVYASHCRTPCVG